MGFGAAPLWARSNFLVSTGSNETAVPHGQRRGAWSRWVALALAWICFAGARGPLLPHCSPVAASRILKRSTVVGTVLQTFVRLLPPPRPAHTRTHTGRRLTIHQHLACLSTECRCSIWLRHCTVSYELIPFWFAVGQRRERARVCWTWFAFCNVRDG